MDAPTSPYIRPMRGDDLYSDLTISAAAAQAGTNATISYDLPSKDTQTSADVRIPAGTRDGTILRVQGMGDFGPNNVARGDLVVTVHVSQVHDKTPTVGIDAKVALLLALALAGMLLWAGRSCSTDKPPVEQGITCSIAFETAGGSTISTQQVAEGDFVTSPSDPHRDGYEFAGWYTSADYSERAVFPFKATGDTVVYAKWEKEEEPNEESVVGPTTYIVSFETGGGSTVSSQSVAEGAYATSPADPTRSGYEFSGWYTSANYTELVTFPFKVTSDTILYARWEMSPEQERQETALVVRPDDTGADGYVLPLAQTHRYTRSELEELSIWELYIARNEIPARHGYIFIEDDLSSYFKSKNWYREALTGTEFRKIEGILNHTEEANVETILALERERGSTLAPKQ